VNARLRPHVHFVTLCIGIALLLAAAFNLDGLILICATVLILASLVGVRSEP
jgi:hypothetical protein